jgi:predicted N-acetyltransferase YhbS
MVQSSATSFLPRIEGEGKTYLTMGLVPIAVLPEWPRQGIGTHPIKAGMDILKDRGSPVVIVHGLPEYYPRFGFERASPYGIHSQWEECQKRHSWSVFWTSQPRKDWMISGLIQGRVL